MPTATWHMHRRHRRRASLQELDDSALNLQTDSVSSGLLARASTAVDSDEGMNTSRDGSLDVVAAKKNPFKFVESIANTVKDAGTVVADAGACPKWLWL